MKRTLFALLLALVLILPVQVLASATPGTCTITAGTSETTNARIPDSETVIITLTCVGGSAGAFPATVVPLTPSADTNKPYNLYGYYLYQVGRTTGTTQPTASYTVTITDGRLYPVDLGLLTSNGAAAGLQLTAIFSSTVAYPVVRSAPTVAITGNSVPSAQITLDLIYKAK